MNPSKTVLILGATPAGLLAAAKLAKAGVSVRVLDERATADAGSVHVRRMEVELAHEPLFPRAAFDSALRESDLDAEEIGRFARVHTLARYYFPGGAFLDWTSDALANEHALTNMLGPKHGQAYQGLVKDAQEALRLHRDRIWKLDKPTWREALQAAFKEGPALLRRGMASRTVRDEVRMRFSDPLVHGVFDRYARMLGSDPRRVPATALLLHAAELEGAYALRGGTRALVQGLERAALRAGARFHYGTKGIRVVSENEKLTAVESIGATWQAAAVVIATEAPVLGISAPACSVDRSSASMVEWAFIGHVAGRALARETWLGSYSPDEELDDIFQRGILPRNPSVRLLAQERGDGTDDTVRGDAGTQRFVLSVQAPSNPRASTDEELDALEKRVFERVHEAGVSARMGAVTRLDPRDFIGMWPAARSGIFGPNAHGIFAPLAKGGTESPIQGVFNATKRTHPGPLLSMQLAAGQRAANAALALLR